MKVPNKEIHIIGGGTYFHVRNHFSFCSAANGTTARKLRSILEWNFNPKMDIHVHLTRQARGLLIPELDGEFVRRERLSTAIPETNEQLAALVDDITKNPATKIVFFNAAVCDYEGYILDGEIPTESGKYSGRLNSRDSRNEVNVRLLAGDKIVTRIRKARKDIFLVAFKTTCGMSPDDQYKAGLHLLKEASANLVLANDTKTRLNMVITPEEARYHVTENRDEALKGLCEMALLRSHLTFTRSTVVAGTPVKWDSPEVPEALRKVVDHCISRAAYKPFRGATVGHFAAKVKDDEFLTSIRKSNFNDLASNGLVRIKTDGPDSVMAFGAKPSVGGQSQRIVFHDHDDYDCIVHFHCPLKADHKDPIPVASQREYECGSHECGRNTSKNLKKFGNLSCVFLDQHGPNIVFNKSIDPAEVISFIESNFDLAGKTGGDVRE